MDSIGREYTLTYESLSRAIELINKKILESWYSQGKKVHVKSYTSLTVKEDVDPELFDAVIERLKCMGSLRIPTEVYTRVAHKIRCFGGVDTY